MSLLDELREFAEREGERLVTPTMNEIPKILAALVRHVEGDVSSETESGDNQ